MTEAARGSTKVYCGPNSQLSRQQRRQLARLNAGVDEITQADKRYFERFPVRQHRIRRMGAAEIGSLAVMSNLHPVPEGCARFTLVKNVAPGFRLRIFIHGPADKSGDETGELVAAALWEEHLRRDPQARQQVLAMETAARLPGGPLYQNDRPTE